MRRTLIYALIVAAAAASAATSAYAQDNSREDWKKKMMSEKVAFLTVELDLTPEEAQTFWPVYNKIDKVRDEAQHAVFKSFFDLEKALNDKKSSKEIDNLLRNYIDALEKQKEIDNDALEDFKKVLPTEKVARLYISEEKFRRQFIRRLQGGGEHGRNGHQANR